MKTGSFHLHHNTVIGGNSNDQIKREAGTVNNWKWLTDTVPTGQEGALPMHDLAIIHGLSARQMRLAVENARRDGVLICSSDRGYFMPETIFELQEYARRTSARLRTGRACLAPFLRELKKAGV